MTQATTTGMQVCDYCHGSGTYLDMHYWSDGWGQVEGTCKLCKGSGETEDHRGLLRRLVEAEEKLAETSSALDRTRTDIALYMLAKAGRLDPPNGNGSPRDNPEGTGLKLAPHPSSHASTWKEYLVEHAKKAPRSRKGRLGYKKEEK